MKKVRQESSNPAFSLRRRTKFVRIPGFRLKSEERERKQGGEGLHGNFL